MPEQKDIFTKAWEFLCEYSTESLNVTGKGSVIGFVGQDQTAPHNKKNAG